MDSPTVMNRFLGVHEYATDIGFGELQQAGSTPWSTRMFSLLNFHSRRTFALHYKFGAAPRDLLHLSGDEKIIDTQVPHDGYRLHYRLEGSVNDPSPVLIFCNGLNCDLHMWDAAIASLKQLFPNFRFLRYGTWSLCLSLIESD